MHAQAALPSREHPRTRSALRFSNLRLHAPQVSLAAVSLRSVCQLLLAGAAAAALLPGLVHARAAPPVTATLLLVQAKGFPATDCQS